MTQPKHWTAEYVDELRDRARLLREYKDDRGAEIVELHASEIEKRAAAYDSEELEIGDAAAISGYHPETLRRLKREGRWSGRRGDLPRHERTGPAMSVESNDEGSVSIAERITSRGRANATPRRTG